MGERYEALHFFFVHFKGLRRSHCEGPTLNKYCPALVQDDRIDVSIIISGTEPMITQNTCFAT